MTICVATGYQPDNKTTRKQDADKTEGHLT